MFEENKDCRACSKSLVENERNFGISIRGFTYVFCNDCTKNKRDLLKRLLHDE